MNGTFHLPTHQEVKENKNVLHFPNWTLFFVYVRSSLEPRQTMKKDIVSFSLEKKGPSGPAFILGTIRRCMDRLTNPCSAYDLISRYK